MEISVTKQAGRVEVTTLGLSGQLDGQNFQQVIDKAKELHASGSRDFVFDMSDLTYISSAGLVALHTVALMLRGETTPDLDNGWASMKAVKKEVDAKPQQHMKLFNPRPEVKSVLEMVGFDRVFEIHSSLDKAVQSF